MIPDRVIEILRRCEKDQTACFPPTEIFNEGWMLRLVLDAIQSCGIEDHPLRFLSGSRWFSEALLISQFRPRSRADPLGEGFTNADGVIGHFKFQPSTKAGLELTPDCCQFVVVEAKMFSNLSAGTKNAPAFNQAARNVACMAAALSNSTRRLTEIESIGFLVLAPSLERRRQRGTNLESCVTADTIRSAVEQRIVRYEEMSREESKTLREWQAGYFLPLVDRLVHEQRLAVLSWEGCIEAVAAKDRIRAGELQSFYGLCLRYASTSSANPENPASMHAESVE